MNGILVGVVPMVGNLVWNIVNDDHAIKAHQNNEKNKKQSELIKHDFSHFL